MQSGFRQTYYFTILVTVPTAATHHFAVSPSLIIGSSNAQKLQNDNNNNSRSNILSVNFFAFYTGFSVTETNDSVRASFLSSADKFVQNWCVYGFWFFVFSIFCCNAKIFPIFQPFDVVLWPKLALLVWIKISNKNWILNTEQDSRFTRLSKIKNKLWSTTGMNFNILLKLICCNCFGFVGKLLPQTLSITFVRCRRRPI